MLTEFQKQKFTKLFTTYDSDNCGQINLSDFAKIVEKVAEVRGLKANSPQSTALLEKYSYFWMRLQSKIDTDRDRKVSLEEWLNYYHGILHDEDRYESEINVVVNMIFDVFDTDGQGTICIKEWIDFMSVHHIHRIYAEQSFAKIDINQDGFICKNEFLNVFRDFHYSDDPKALGNYLFMPY